jgi:hypothetical protein
MFEAAWEEELDGILRVHEVLCNDLRVGSLTLRAARWKNAALPMEIIIWLQESAVARWVGAAPTLLAYPTILTLHTVGMSIVVGTCAVMDLRLLGVASDVPLAGFRRAPLLVWSGFGVNAVTGVLLFLPSAETKATQTIFFIKLGLIALALMTYGRIRRLAFRDDRAPALPVSSEVKALAVLSLLLWIGATVAGRLMAYIQ